MSTIEADNRASAYLEDGGKTIVLRASAIGGCTRDLVLHLLGNEPLAIPDEVQKRFDAGTTAEPHILQRMRDEGWLFEEGLAQQAGDLKVLPAGDGKPAVIVRYHPDGVACHRSPWPDEYWVAHKPIDDAGAWKWATDLHIVEAKALAESSWEQASRKGTGSLFNYDWQLSVMMHASRLPGVWVALKKNPDDLDDYSGPLHIEFVDKAPIRFGEIVKKAKGIRDAYLSGDAPDCSDPNQYPCPFLYLRPEKEGPEFVDLELSEADEFEQLASEYDVLTAVVASGNEADRARKEVRKKLDALAGGRLAVRGNGWRMVTTISDRPKMIQSGERYETRTIKVEAE